MGLGFSLGFRIYGLGFGVWLRVHVSVCGSGRMTWGSLPSRRLWTTRDVDLRFNASEGTVIQV